jgi:hypothetical protein
MHANSVLLMGFWFACGSFLFVVVLAVVAVVLGLIWKAIEFIAQLLRGYERREL